MEIGFIGLGRMGSNMVLNLLDHKHKVVVYNRSPEKTRKIAKNGAIPSYSIEEFISKLPKSKIIWLMITSGKYVDELINKLIPFLDKGSIIIDGGNSYYKDSQKRYKELKNLGISFLDVGVAGGVDGARNGCAVLIGGDKKVFEICNPIFKSLSVKDGYGYLGPNGSGHFAKGIHNAIEYGIMASISEGMDVIDKNKSNLDINLKKVSKVYAHGSILESKFVGWMDKGINRKDFKNISGSVPEGETEGEMKKLQKGFNMKILKEAIEMREQTRKKPSFKGKLISVIRNEFGGHAVKKK